MPLNILRTVVLAALVIGGGLVTSVLGYEPENYLLESMPRPPEDVRELEGEMNTEHLMLLGVVLGKTPSSELTRKFGPAGQIKAGHHEDLVCYRSTAPEDNTMVTFSADMHGGQSVYNFQLISGHQPFESRKHCTPSSLISKTVATHSGIKLGLTTAAFKQIIGVPMAEAKGHVSLDYVAYKDEASDTGKLGCSIVFSGLSTRFEKDKLVWLLVSRGTEFASHPCEEIKR